VVAVVLEPNLLDSFLAIPRSGGAGVSLIDNKGMHAYRYPATKYTWEQRNWLKLYPALGEALKGKEVVAIATFGAFGMRRIVAFTPISSIGWVASCSRAESEVVKAIVATLLPHALGTFLFIMAAFCGAIFLSRPISASIVRLRNHAQALGRGDIQNLTHTSGPGELKDLAETFNNMAEKVRSRAEALRISEQRWVATLVSIGDAVIATDLEGKIAFMNAVAEDLTGWTFADASKKPVMDVFNIIKEQTRKGVDSPVSMVLREGTVVGLANHTILIRKDGAEVPIDDSSAPIRDKDGTTSGVVLVFRDISDRKRAEEERRLTNERLNLAQTAVGSGVWDWDVSTGHINWSDRMFELFGLDSAKTTASFDAWKAVLHPEDVETAGLRIDNALKQGTGLNSDYRVILADGQTRWINATGKGEYDDNGNPVRMIGSCMDITERKQIEEELHRSRDELELRVQERTESLRRQAEALSTSEKEFRVLAEAMPQIVWITRADGWNIYFNQQWVDYTGLTLEESYGHGWNKPFHSDDRQRAWDAWQNAITNNGTYSLECRLRAADGTYRWWLVRGVPVVNEKRETTKWFGTCTDIEEFKKVEAQLRQAQKLEALGTLSGGIAHDFNNILAAIIGFTELLHDHVPKGSREARHAERVLEAALRGRELVTQMLTFSRKTDTEKKPLRLSTIIREGAKLLRASIPTTIDIRVNVLSESGVILADSTQIQQVLMNLATNAAHAMREKGGVLDIELRDFSVSGSNGDPRGIEPGLYMGLVVRDSGAGMPPHLMDRIFDPFFTTKAAGEGTGLGLSVVLGIVRQSNSYIFAESELGKGSVFTVYFPKIAEEPSRDTATDHPVPTGSERILFVDDEEALVEMGEELLAELGYEVICRRSSKDALSLIKENPLRFDLVITDQTMPEMTGVALVKEILAVRPDMPVIMCTGFSHVVDAEQARMAGIKAFCNEAPQERGDRQDNQKGARRVELWSCHFPMAILTQPARS
jgi:PAS domain S-box-containing protein